MASEYRSPFTTYVKNTYVSSLPEVTRLSISGPHTLPQYMTRRTALGVSHRERCDLWPRLIQEFCNKKFVIPERSSPQSDLRSRLEAKCANLRVALMESEKGEESGADSQLLQGLGWADRRLMHTYHLTHDGELMVQVILHYLSQDFPQIVYAPHAWCLTALFLHYLEPQVVVQCMDALLRLPEEKRRVVQDTRAWQAHCLSLDTLVERIRPLWLWNRMRHTDFLPNHEARRELLSSWFFAIFDLPFECVVRVVDCFLSEGIKILYRVGMALYKLSKPELMSMAEIREVGQQPKKKVQRSQKSKMPMKNSPTTGAEWWEEGDLAELAPTAPAPDNSEAERRRLRLDFLRNFASGYDRNASQELLETAFFIRNISSANIEAALRKAAKRVSGVKSQDLVGLLVQQCARPGDMPHLAMDLHRGDSRRPSLSQLVTDDDLAFVLREVDNRRLVENFIPRVLFDSDLHGSYPRNIPGRCRAYYQETGNPETILLIRTASGCGVFGAFLTSQWSLDHGGSYYGNGETFVFRLRPGPRKIYRWRKDGPSYFQRLTDDVLEVGGGISGGPAAIRLTMSTGQSGPSATFWSQCLVTEPEDRYRVYNHETMVWDIGERLSGESCSFVFGKYEILGFLPPSPCRNGNGKRKQPQSKDT